MGSLAWLYAQQSNMEQARKLLLEGEPLVEVDPKSTAMLLFCKQSKVLHMIEIRAKAKESLGYCQGDSTPNQWWSDFRYRKKN